MFKKKKQSKKQSKAKETVMSNGLVENDNGHFQLDESLRMRSQLKGIAKLIGDGELSKMIKLHMTADQINKRMNRRLLMVVIFFVIPFLLPIFIKINMVVIVISAFLLAGIMWFADMLSINRYFTNYQIKRAIAWSRFLRMAASFLPELKTGVNMFSILKKIVPRMTTDEDRDNLNRLIVKMSRDPEDSQPFLNFAHSYSASQRSEMIMLVIQDMYLGDISSENIQLLADDATKELTAQIAVITEHKLNKFKSASFQFAIVGMIPVIGYVLYNVFTLIMNALKSMAI